jgi:apolipoprotein N-acyltransferase
MGRLWAAVPAALAGVLQALAIAWPTSGEPLWWLQVLSLASLVALLERQPHWRSAFAVGWVFATAWLAATFWWLFISMHVYGGLAAPLAVLAVFALAAFLALYYGAAAAAFAAWRGRGPVRGAVLFASAWLGAELMRGTWFTGFPWGAGGYAHVDGPLAALAPWAGVYGIGTVAALAACALSLLASPAAGRSWQTWLVAGGALGLLAACTLVADRAAPAPTGSGPKFSVALLQGNIPQDEKFQGGTGIPVALNWYGTMLRDAQASLVVAPETAIPLLPRQLPPGYLEAVTDPFRGGTKAALLGIPLGNTEQGYTNSVLGFQGAGEPYRYDKHHLVPFGEFIPPLFKWFTRMMNIPLGDFARGGIGQPSFAWQGQRLAPNVCYEDLFGEELGARFLDEAQAPTVFVNVSNIGWFGNSVAIDQHLHISRMRALEFRRPMIRATNTGATVIIDAGGRVTHALPRHTRGVLAGEVQGGSGITPFAWWVARFGLWPLWALAGLGVAAAWATRERKPPPYN